MKQSKLFTKTRKEAPKDEVSKNAQLLIRAGYIHKEMAGVYSYTPLGLRILKKIENIIREEMNAVGGQELLMSSFHPKEYWLTTGRWDSMDDLYKVTDASGREVALGPTHEEMIVPIVKEYISSYKDLPFSVYQFQNKFRMELRAKSGILRGREFIMKDMYSFHTTEEDMISFYEKVKQAYVRIFDRAGIGEKTLLTFASGGSFSKYSHEFQTVTGSGEDIIYIDKEKNIALNKEVYTDEIIAELGLNKKSLVEEKSIEVGNIFQLKTKFSAPFELNYTDQDGTKKPVIMGCYGIGLGRLLGTIVEVLSDEKGMVWPESVAPFKVHLVEIKGSDLVSTTTERIYNELTKAGVEVLWDDRDVRAGEKFADSDLMGLPYRVVVSEKTCANKQVELKKRSETNVNLIDQDKLLNSIS